MRFMILVKATEESETGAMPSQEILTSTTRATPSSPCA